MDKRGITAKKKVEEKGNVQNKKGKSWKRKCKEKIYGAVRI